MRAREFELALPAELTKEQRRELATDFAKSLVDNYGVAADVALHEPSRKGTSAITTRIFLLQPDKSPLKALESRQT